MSLTDKQQMVLIATYNNIEAAVEKAAKQGKSVAECDIASSYLPIFEKYFTKYRFYQPLIIKDWITIKIAF